MLCAPTRDTKTGSATCNGRAFSSIQNLYQRQCRICSKETRQISFKRKEESLCDSGCESGRNRPQETLPLRPVRPPAILILDHEKIDQDSKVETGCHTTRFRLLWQRTGGRCCTGTRVLTFFHRPPNGTMPGTWCMAVLLRVPYLLCPCLGVRPHHIGLFQLARHGHCQPPSDLPYPDSPRPLSRSEHVATYWVKRHCVDIRGVRHVE